MPSTPTKRDLFQLSEPVPLWDSHPTSPTKTPLSNGPVSTPRAKSAYAQRQNTSVDFTSHPLTSPRGLDIGEFSFRGHRRAATDYSWEQHQRGNLLSMQIEAEQTNYGRRMNLQACQKVNTSAPDIVAWQTPQMRGHQKPATRGPTISLRSFVANQPPPPPPTPPNPPLSEEARATARSPGNLRSPSTQSESMRNYQFSSKLRSKSLGDMMGTSLRPMLHTSAEHPLASPTLIHISEKAARAYRQNPQVYLRKHGLSTLISSDQERPVQRVESSQPVNYAKKSSDISAWKSKQVLHREHMPRGSNRFTPVISPSRTRNPTTLAHQRRNSSSSNSSRRAWR